MIPALDHMSLMRIPRLLAGSDALKSLPNSLKEYSNSKVLVVTCEDLVRYGVYEKLRLELQKIPNLELVCFSHVLADPEIDLVEEIAALGRKEGVNLVLALGGGSVIDAAKIACAMIPTKAKVYDLIGTGLVEASLPLIAIPTTAGTGSEVTPVAIVTDVAQQVKKGVVSTKIIPELAILDASLTAGLPKTQTAFTGLDALSHAVEAYLSKFSTLLTDFYAKEAIRIIRQALPVAYDDGENLKARGQMQIAAFYAGIAFANAGVTAAHAFAYPLGARYHMPHGLAVTLMMPAVLEYNQSAQEERFADLAKIFTANPSASHLEFIPRMVLFCQQLGIHLGLNQNKVQIADLKPMAESVLGITRILNNNPRPIVSISDAEGILQRAYAFS